MSKSKKKQQTMPNDNDEDKNDWSFLKSKSDEHNVVNTAPPESQTTMASLIAKHNDEIQALKAQHEILILQAKEAAKEQGKQAALKGRQRERNKEQREQEKLRDKKIEEVSTAIMLIFALTDQHTHTFSKILEYTRKTVSP
jgi:hypothetical protein